MTPKFNWNSILLKITPDAQKQARIVHIFDKLRHLNMMDTKTTATKFTALTYDNVIQNFNC